MAEKEVRKLAAVMFTDIQGYTAFVQKDESEALKKVATHRKYLEKFTAESNGRVVSFYGDGSLSIYESALDAVNCGIAMQRAYQADHPIPVRIGIHVGDIVFKDDTVFGDGVNIASRIQASGIPGSVFISDRVHAELRNHPEIKTKSIGRKSLKNVSTPIEIFVVTNDGLTIPSGMTRMPDLKKFVRYIPLILIGGLAWWFFNRSTAHLFGDGFTEESISVPPLSNNTGDSSLNHVAQMAAHWITKELSATPEAHVVSYETTNQLIQLSGVSLGTKQGRAQYTSLTGAVNVVEAFYSKIGARSDSLMMSGWIKNLRTGDVIQALKDVKCSSANPMDCIEEMSGNIRGYWASRDDKLLTPPSYEAYKAYIAAKNSWGGPNTEFVFDQLKKAIKTDPDFIDAYFLMLGFFYNEGRHQEAHDTIESMRKKFTNLDQRQTNLLLFHTEDVAGRNKEAYKYYLQEYEKEPKDLFKNNSAMVMALTYKKNPREALTFFNNIPYDSLQINGCTYCAERFEIAMWAALQIDSMTLADRLAPKINNALYTRQSYGMLIMYEVWKKDTMKIDQLISDSRHHPNYDETWEYLNYLAARLFLMRNDPVLASRYAQKAIEANLSLPNQKRMLGRSYYLNNQFDKALIALKAARTTSPKDTRILAEIGGVYARQGNKVEAKKIIDQLESMRVPFDYGTTEYFQGRIYALTGDFEQAVRLLSVAVSKGQKYALWLTFDDDPDLMVLKDYPGYIQLMKSW